MPTAGSARERERERRTIRFETELWLPADLLDTGDPLLAFRDDFAR